MVLHNVPEGGHAMLVSLPATKLPLRCDCLNEKENFSKKHLKHFLLLLFEGNKQEHVTPTALRRIKYHTENTHKPHQNAVENDGTMQREQLSRCFTVTKATLFFYDC